MKTILILILLTTTAQAGFIDVGQAFSSTIQPYVNAAIEAGIAGLISWVLLKVKDKFHVDIEAQNRAALTEFLQRQASALIAAGEVKLNGVKVEVKNEALLGAANAAISAIPDTMKFFNLTPEQVKNRIVDLIPQQPAVAAAAAIAIDVKNPQTPSTAAPAHTGL